MKIYLSSYEYDDFVLPKVVLQYQKAIIDGRNVLIVEVDRPLIGQKYNLLDEEIAKFYLINRVDENAFNKLDNFPIDVHVLIKKRKEIINPHSLSELQNIAWACLYNNLKDAEEHKIV